MRYDLFESKKSVHVKFTKEMHAALRMKLFQSGLTMQDLFFYAAQRALGDGPDAEKFLTKISKLKMQRALSEIRGRSAKFHIGELDSETLYSLMDDQNGKQQDVDEEAAGED